MGRLTGEEIDSIKHLYQSGKGSIQDYARIYRVEVDEILEVLELNELRSIQYQGDLVDAEEMAEEAHKIRAEGGKRNVPYTTN